jgi:hypothetical protein
MIIRELACAWKMPIISGRAPLTAQKSKRLVGPGKHAIQMQIPDAADPSYIWTRGFEVTGPGCTALASEILS